MPKMTRDEARRRLYLSGRWRVSLVRCDARISRVTPHDTFFTCLRDGCSAVPEDWPLVRILIANGGHVGVWSDLYLFHMEDIVD